MLELTMTTALSHLDPAVLLEQTEDLGDFHVRSIPRAPGAVRLSVRTAARTIDAICLSAVPGYAPYLNPVEYLWAWLKRHALANFRPDTLTELKDTARRKLKSGQKRKSIITDCWKQAEL